MTEPKRIPVYTMKEPEHQDLNVLAEIVKLRARGWGVDDISVKLGIHRNFIRPFIIPRRKK